MYISTTQRFEGTDFTVEAVENEDEFMGIRIHFAGAYTPYISMDADEAEKFVTEIRKVLDGRE